MTQGEQNRGLILPGLQRWVTTDLIDWRTSSVERRVSVVRVEIRGSMDRASDSKPVRRQGSVLDADDGGLGDRER